MWGADKMPWSDYGMFLVGDSFIQSADVVCRPFEGCIVFVDLYVTPKGIPRPIVSHVRAIGCHQSHWKRTDCDSLFRELFAAAAKKPAGDPAGSVAACINDREPNRTNRQASWTQCPHNVPSLSCR